MLLTAKPHPALDSLVLIVTTQFAAISVDEKHHWIFNFLRFLGTGAPLPHLCSEKFKPIIV